MFPPARSLCLIAAVLGSSTVISLTEAADLYILPEGSGTKDATSWANARPGDPADFQAAWDTLAPGDTLHVGSGTYSGVGIVAAKGGVPTKPVKVVGEDRGGGLPRFVSTFDKTNPGKTGGTFFKAAPGVSWFEIAGLRLDNYQSGFLLNGGNSHVRIAKIEMESFREGIRSQSSPPPQAQDEWSHDVIVEDCRFVNFTKRAVRLQGGNHTWKIQRCFADAGGKEWFTEPFAICFQVVGDDLKRKAKEEGAHDHHIEFIDCVALNAYHEKKGGYWNSDGFCAERGVHNLRYLRCYSAGHTDAGWDDKSVAPELVDCIAVLSKRNYRFWGEGVKLTNCVAAFAVKQGGSGGPTGLWTNGTVEGDYCTFYDNDGPPVLVDKEKPGARIVLRNSLLVAPGDPSILEENKGLQLVNSVFVNKEDPANSARIAATVDTERKIGPTAFDSGKFGTTKGFSSTRMTKESQ